MVFGLDRNSAPGPDGFSLAFFQDNCEGIMEDLQKVLNEFYKRCLLNNALNDNFVCLIPKKDKATNVQDFRPISLIIHVYKIISSILAD